MQKITTAILAVLLVISLSACSQSSNSPSQSHPSTSATDPIPDATQTNPTEDFQEILLVDNDQIKIAITGAETDPVWGYGLNVHLENKTDQNLMFTMDDTSVNGFMCDPFWAETVAAGKKSNTTVSWFESDFETNGITSVEEIEFTLRVYDSDDWLADDILNEKFTVNP